MASIYDDYLVLTAETNDGQKTKVRLKADPATGALVVTGAGAEPSATSFKIQDGADVTRLMTVTADGKIGVVVTDLGTLATAAKQDSAKTTLDGIQTNTTGLATQTTLADVLAALANLGDRMWRLLNQHVADGDELRLDLGTTDQYFGVATDGAATDLGGLWDVLRIYLDGDGNPTRMRTRTGVNWDSRTTGWT